MNYKLQAHFLNDVSTWRAHIPVLITMNIIKFPFLHQCRLHSNVYCFKIVQKSFIQSSSNLQEANHLGFSCQQYVHVSFFTTAHPVAVWGVHHGSIAVVECCSHSTASEQLGILASVPVVVYGLVLATISAGVPLFLWYETEKSDFVVIACKPTWN